MKKVILGSAMLLGGLVSIAILLTAAMMDGFYSTWRMLLYFMSMPPLYIPAAIAAIGLALALWGVFEKKD